MHVPLLLGAFLLPVTPGLHDTLVRFEARARVEEQQVLQLAKGEKSQGLIAMIEESAKLSSADRVRMLEMSLPNLAFLGMVLLVAAGRALAGHLALMRGWPADVARAVVGMATSRSRVVAVVGRARPVVAHVPPLGRQSVGSRYRVPAVAVRARL
jgi:hypothetical protein